MRTNNGKITLEEHRQLGFFLRIAQDKLCKESCKITPKKKANSSHELKAYNLIGKLKDHLEEIMFKDFINLTNEVGFNVYYGTSGRLEIKQVSKFGFVVINKQDCKKNA